eukprot:CAMPEP_0183322154 /NCGR_PEP_ID=MMETSP0160_2-20130417/70860_1 /TAXON_ID=2839 ORGANISM="Odontella Sinensis, Strain Grunow 1884" /NCGR_SAMPLE_ID=MMETSP0160_2 /ASSEMBLY_ACC=CAM_ASM_000250 /LENGTH=42 /DNA_ID= /DNA_START= /DNA_END= /DNA_ORIENTATION=
MTITIAMNVALAATLSTVLLSGVLFDPVVSIMLAFAVPIAVA